ncbi:hypothetical protein GGS20DRAFT_76249 [Poronia punctata]|nr:hypothetical protein GGS20DRAFT_76249 [Poronia punctata]
MQAKPSQDQTQGTRTTLDPIRLVTRCEYYIRPSARFGVSFGILYPARVDCTYRVFLLDWIPCRIPRFLAAFSFSFLLFLSFFFSYSSMQLISPGFGKLGYCSYGMIGGVPAFSQHNGLFATQSLRSFPFCFRVFFLLVRKSCHVWSRFKEEARYTIS